MTPDRLERWLPEPWLITLKLPSVSRTTASTSSMEEDPLDRIAERTSSSVTRATRIALLSICP